MQVVRNFFKKKTVMFYVCLCAALLSVIVAIVYASAYSGSRYMSRTSFALSLLGGLLFVGLSIIDETTGFAPAVMGIFNLVSLCLYIDAVYMYLTEVFYGGVNWASMQQLNPAFVFCLVGMLVTVGISIAGVFTRQIKAERKEKTVDESLILPVEESVKQQEPNVLNEEAVSEAVEKKSVEAPPKVKRTPEERAAIYEERAIKHKEKMHKYEQMANKIKASQKSKKAEGTDEAATPAGGEV